MSTFAVVFSSLEQNRIMFIRNHFQTNYIKHRTSNG